MALAWRDSEWWNLRRAVLQGRDRSNNLGWRHARPGPQRRSDRWLSQVYGSSWRGLASDRVDWRRREAGFVQHVLDCVRHRRVHYGPAAEDETGDRMALVDSLCRDLESPELGREGTLACTGLGMQRMGDLHMAHLPVPPQDPLLALAMQAAKGQAVLHMPFLVVQGGNQALWQQGIGVWRTSLPWQARSVDVPSLLLSLHCHFGYKWPPRAGGFLHWRPRRFNVQADGLAGDALESGAGISQWHLQGIRIFIRSLHDASHRPLLHCIWDGAYSPRKGEHMVSVLCFSLTENLVIFIKSLA